MKTLGNALFMFFRLQVIEGVGRDLYWCVILKFGGLSSPSTGLILCVDFRGFSMYFGKFSNVHEKPDAGGLAGLNATSYSMGGWLAVLGFLCGIGISSPITSLVVLKPPQTLAR